MSDITAMAKEAGLRDWTCNGTYGCLERFAELVRAEEREACAKLADDTDPVWYSIGAAIRARSKT